MWDLLLKNADFYIQGKLERGCLAISGHRIAEVHPHNPSAKEERDLKGLTVLPGIIDTQVHFREPGLTHKEDFEAGTRAALKGGVTAVFDMPNTLPPITSQETYHAKKNQIASRSWVDFALFMGCLPFNIENLGDLEKLPGCAGVKVFLGKSTGGLCVHQQKDLERLLQVTNRKVAFHCEDEDLLNERQKLIPHQATSHFHPQWRNEDTAFIATKRIVSLAKTLKRKIHILHVTTAQEMDYLKAHKGSLVTVEVLPQHLIFSFPEDYDRLGSLIQMNPPIRSREHQDRLWQAINDGTVDVVGSDHAPHLLSEKQKPYPQSPSGMPGVQTLLPLMLNMYSKGKLSLQRLVELLCINPAKIYQIQGMGHIGSGQLANLTIVDLKKQKTITNDWIESKCKWTPYDGMTVYGWPISAIIEGKVALWQEEIIGKPYGRSLDFKF